MDRVKKIIGEPRNYGPTPEERAEIERKKQEEQVWSLLLTKIRVTNVLMHCRLVVSHKRGRRKNDMMQRSGLSDRNGKQNG